MRNESCPLCSKNITEEIKINLFKCQNCELQFINNIEDSSYYNNYFEEYRSNPNDQEQKKRKEQYEIDSDYFLFHFSGDTILDVGCSSGELISKLNSIKKYNYYGIDIDHSGIEVAINKKLGDNVQFESIDLLDFSQDIKFDAIIFRGTFQYLSKSLEKYILKCKNILKENGLIYIYSLPNSDSFIYKILGENWHLYNANEHKLIFNKKSIEFISMKFQFDIIDFQFPYIETPYANIEKDYQSVINIIKNGDTISSPFWGSMMQCILKNKK